MEFERYAKFAPKRSKNKEPPKLKLFLERFGANFEYLLNSTNLDLSDILYFECAHRHSGNSIFAGKSALKLSKNKLVRQNAVTRAHGSCSLRVMGSCVWKI